MHNPDKELGMEDWYDYAIVADFIDKSELPVLDPETRIELCPRCTTPKLSGALPAMSHHK